MADLRNMENMQDFQEPFLPNTETLISMQKPPRICTGGIRPETGLTGNLLEQEIYTCTTLLSQQLFMLSLGCCRCIKDPVPNFWL